MVVCSKESEKMKAGKRLLYPLMALLVTACSDDDGDSSDSESPASMTMTVVASEIIPGRYYFDQHEIIAEPGYNFVDKTLTIIDSTTGDEVHQETDDDIDGDFRQKRLDQGEYSIRLTATFTRNSLLGSGIDPNLTDFHYSGDTADNSTFYEQVVEQKVNAAEWFEIPLTDEVDGVSECLANGACVADATSFCSYPSDVAMPVACELSTSCYSVDLVELMDYLNLQFDHLECGDSVHIDDEDPVIIWAKGASGSDGGFNDGGDGGNSGNAAMVTRVADLYEKYFQTNVLYYALGKDGDDPMNGDSSAGGSATAVLLAATTPSEESVLLVAPGGGGGEQSGRDGYDGGVAFSSTFNKHDTGQGGGGSKGGGADGCTPGTDCGGTSGENDGGDGWLGHGGKNTDGEYTPYWTNIPEEDLDDESKFGYILKRAGGQGGVGDEEEILDDTDGGGGGGYGGGASGDGDHGGGGGGGAYAAAPTIITRDVDMQTLEREINQPTSGNGAIFLIWHPVKE